MHSDAQRDFMSLMSQINRRWRKLIDRTLQPLGLTEAAWLPLLHIARSAEPMRQKDLAASLSLDGSSLVRLLDGLEKAGLVERSEGADRRAKILRLTTQGQHTVKQVEELVAHARDAIFADIPDEDFRHCIDTLTRLSTALTDAEERVGR